MKKVLALILALASVVCMATFCVGAADDGLVKQEIEYTEVDGRVNQIDSGFTISSKYVYPGGRYEGEEPMNDSGFQFYYLGLNRWSANADGKDEPLPKWYLDWLDASLANLRANGGGCMIRATYALDGHEKREPKTFDLLLKHQSQLAEVFSKYPDLIVAIECGMIGAFGEMWGGLYSNAKYKAQVLEGWLKQTPEAITINVRTAEEYIYYINYSELFRTKYKNKKVGGVQYPPILQPENFCDYTFDNEEFSRIGCYNDAMIQDGNDGGSFTGGRDNFNAWLGRKSHKVSYGGEFSGAAGNYRWGSSIWLPMRSIPEFYLNNLTYYHGGNNAYKVTGKYYSEYVNTGWYADMEKAEEAKDKFFDTFAQYGAGMAHGAQIDTYRTAYTPKSGKKEADIFESFEEAQAAADAYEASGAGNATAQVGVTYTTGGWSSAIYGDELIAKVVETAEATADMDDYKGRSVGDFFDDHLGYRIVLRSSEISGNVVQGGTLRVKGSLDNVGTANITRDKVTEIVITNGTDTYVAATNVNPKDWKSAQRSLYDIELKLPGSLPVGEYEVYMRVAGQDIEGNTAAAGSIRFCNPGQFRYDTLGSAYSVGAETLSIIYNSEICGNYLGTFNVTAGSTPLSDESFKQAFTSFDDIPATGKWYSEAVLKAGSLGLMNGVNASNFGPDNNMNRGMLVTVLYRMEGEPSVANVRNPFRDVPREGKYYSEAVLWASANDIVNGTGSGTFSPTNQITRAQLSTILYRYAQYKGYDTSKTTALTSFPDQADVPSWASEALSWAAAEELVTGVKAGDKTILKPQGNASRAQVATILIRYLTNIVFAK